MHSIEPITPYPLPHALQRDLAELAAGVGLLDDLVGIGYRGLGMEINFDQREPLLSWIQGQEETVPAFFGPADWRDGRGNLQVLSLIEQLRGRGDDWHLLCFDIGQDQPCKEWREREEWLEKNLVQTWQ